MVKNKSFLKLKAYNKKDGTAKGGRTSSEKNIVSVLDIGSSKICCFIAEVKSHGTIEVIGIGHHAARGIKSGTVVDLKAAELSVAHAVEDAETMAKEYLGSEPIKSVFVNVSGVNTTSHQTSVDIKVAGHSVTDRDVRAALSHSRTLIQPGKDELVHVIPAEYILDKTRGIQEPRGMVGDNLSVNITAITGSASSLCHISAIVLQNQLELDGFCSSAYASGLSTLTEDEMQLGCTVIDMGGGTTSIGVFYGGKLIYTAAVPLGGSNVTNDIARGLTTSISDAERIKTLYGSAHSTATDDSAMIDVPPIGEDVHSQPNYVPRSLLTGIIQPRIEEIFELVSAKLIDSGINYAIGRRVVLTGGASQLPGLSDVAKVILDKQVRLGKPQKIAGLADATAGPAFATASGILIYAAERANEIPEDDGVGFLSFSSHINDRFLRKVMLWLKDNW